MNAGYEEVHDELRAVARDLLAKIGADWNLFSQSGWLGLEVPETLGGSGVTFAEVAVVLEELGRVAARTPYLSTVVLGVGALNRLEPHGDRDELLRRVASGDAQIAVALTSGDDDNAGAAPFRIEAAATGLQLYGGAAFVPGAAESDELLLLALDPDAVPVLVRADPRSVSMTVTAQPLLDSSRAFGIVTADGVAVNEAAVWKFRGDPDGCARGLLDRGAVAVACDSLGASEAMLAATVAYAGVRKQFGRPIGSFQAVKHACADMLVQTAVSRDLLSAAVGALARDDRDAAVAVSMAKSYVCSAAVEIVGKAMQLHGGIGYTWESGIHTYLKRVALNRSLFGSPIAHRKRLAARYVT